MEPGQVDKDGRQICICSDSIRSVSGRCPPKHHREYYHCPQRKGLFPIDEVTKKY